MEIISKIKGKIIFLNAGAESSTYGKRINITWKLKEIFCGINFFK
jgi:hypothetical protein